MAGIASPAAHSLGPMVKRTSLHHTLHGMASVKLDKVHIFLMEIQTHRISSPKVNALLAFVDHLTGSCNDVQIFKNSVIQNHFYIPVDIPESDL